MGGGVSGGLAGNEMQLLMSKEIGEAVRQFNLSDGNHSYSAPGVISHPPGGDKEVQWIR